MNRLALVLLMCAQGCSAEKQTPSPLHGPQPDVVLSPPSENDRCSDSLRRINPGSGPAAFDIAKSLGGLKGQHAENFGRLPALDIACPVIGLLPDFNRQGGDAKPVGVGRTDSAYWVAYTYLAERMKAGLYGYMTTIVLYDSAGNGITSQPISEYMADEGYARLVRSTIADGQITRCIREAELFRYDSNGDVSEELDAPVYTEESCGPAHAIGSDDGRSSFPLMAVTDCESENSSVNYCDKRHANAMRRALRSKAPDFNEHFIVVRIPEGEGSESYAAIDTRNGVAYPLLTSNDAGRVGRGSVGTKAGSRNAQYSLESGSVCLEGAPPNEQKCYVLREDNSDANVPSATWTEIGRQ